MDRVDLTLDVLPDLFGAPVRTPVARTPAGWVTMGVADDLDEAMAIALDAMLDVMAALHGIGRLRRARAGQRGGRPAGHPGGEPGGRRARRPPLGRGALTPRDQVG